MNIEPAEFVAVASRYGLAAPGMVLDDERCIEMAEHCRKTLQIRARTLKIHLPDWGNIPRVSPKSMLYLRPCLTVVSTFPIDEHYAFDSVEFGRIDIGRPLFYCELRGADLKKGVRRYNDTRRRRPKRTRSLGGEQGVDNTKDVAPKSPRRREVD